MIIILSIISTIVTAGIPGFASYLYLSKNSVLQHGKEDKDEKIIVLSILSILNMGVTYYVFRIITGVDPLKDLNWINAPFLFGTGIIVTFIMTAFYSKVIAITNKYWEKNRLENSQIIKNKKTIYDRALHRYNKPIFVYIFNFKNEFIESGYFYQLDELNGKLRIGLSNNTEHTKEIPTIEEVLNAFNTLNDTTKKEIIVDVDNQLKLFLFYV
ncbi:MAG TPA: hypothetical protein VEZ91_01080 [Kurthia gibsonii]|nr:hypothetical protein [Kurthia gibsonii]